MTKGVDVEQLERASAKGAMVLDVRESDEYVGGHIPGAQSMPLGTVSGRLQDLPKSETVYVVCQSGGRSAQAAELMTEAGLDARSVTGGTRAWVDSGRPLEAGGPRQDHAGGRR